MKRKFKKLEIRYSDLANHLRWFVVIGWAVIVWLTIVNVMGILIVGGKITQNMLRRYKKCARNIVRKRRKRNIVR